MTPTICKNCDKTFENGFKFCPHCGQQTKDDLTVGVLFYNTITNYFSFDARFFKSFGPLLLKPGFLAKKFIEGKRLLYLHPAQLYLFISVLFFFLLSVTVVRDQVESIDANLKKVLEAPKTLDSTITMQGRAMDTAVIKDLLQPLKVNSIQGLEQEDLQVLDTILSTGVKKGNEQKASFDFNTKLIDSLIASNTSNEEIYRAMGMEDDAGFLTRKYYEQGLKFYKQRNGGQILQAAYDTIPISLFILLPIFALILMVFFLKRGSYAHHLVFSFYYFSFLFAVFSLILIVNSLIEIPDWIDWLIVLSTFFYLLIAIKRFYRQSWILSFVKTGLISFIYMSFVIPIAIILVFFVSFLSY